MRQFLTDPEYEEIRDDAHTMVELFVEQLAEAGVDVSYYPPRAQEHQKQLEAKITAYVDQTVARYY